MSAESAYAATDAAVVSRPRETCADGDAETAATSRPASRPVVTRTLFLAADIGHMGDARDLAVLVHADVLVVDRVVVVRQRVDHDLLQDTIALVVDADALRVDDLDRGLGALLALYRPIHAVEQRHVAPVLRRI